MQRASRAGQISKTIILSFRLFATGEAHREARDNAEHLVHLVRGLRVAVAHAHKADILLQIAQVLCAHLLQQRPVLLLDNRAASWRACQHAAKNAFLVLSFTKFDFLCDNSCACACGVFVAIDTLKTSGSYELIQANCASTDAPAKMQ